MSDELKFKLTREEEAQVKAAIATVLGPELEEEKDVHAQELRDLKQRGEAALKQAERAAHRGKLAEAKKWTDVAQQMAVAARRVAEIEPPPPDYENEEALRAELRARINRYVEQDNGLSRWRMQRDMWEAMCATARETGAPMPPPLPPRPPHWTDSLPEGMRDQFTDE
ncbi:MAG: hypothetical protein ABUS57_09850 [Pseudomonadota bacterium]